MEIGPELQAQIMQIIKEYLKANKCEQKSNRPVLWIAGDAPECLKELEADWIVKPIESGCDFEQEQVRAVLAWTLSLDELVRVASGMDHPLVQARLRGIEAFVRLEGVEYLQFQQTMPATMAQMYQKMQRKAESYGICFRPWKKIKEMLKGQPDRKELAGVWTAARMEELCRGGQTKLWLPKEAVVTPLAQDIAKEKGIRITQEAAYADL